MKTWTTIDGTEIVYKDLGDSHLLNILKYIEKRAETGVMIITGGGSGWDIEGMWSEEDFIEGEEVLEHYDYKGLKKEAKKRKLI